MEELTDDTSQVEGGGGAERESTTVTLDMIGNQTLYDAQHAVQHIRYNISIYIYIYINT